MIPKVPCKNCSYRKVGCHSDCEKYLIYKNENGTAKNIKNGAERRN